MRALLAPLLVASLVAAAPARLHAQDEGEAKPDTKKDDAPKTDEKKPDDNPRRGPGGRGQMWRYPVERLKEQLNLTDDQFKKIEGFSDEMREAVRKEVQDLQKDGGFDWSKMRDLMPKYMSQMRDKVRSVLTDEQKTKYEELIKEEDKRFREGPRGMGRDPEAMKKRLMEQAEKELSLTPEEKQAVLPLIQKVLDARAEARTNGDKRKEEFTSFVKKATGADDQGKVEIQKRLEDYRKAREVDQQKIKEAQANLREVLTIDNEAKLVSLGILD